MTALFTNYVHQLAAGMGIVAAVTFGLQGWLHWREAQRMEWR